MNKKVMNNQKALDYAMYMIAASYFKKAICDRSWYQEKKLRINYSELRMNDQYDLEDLCIGYMDRELVTLLPEHIWEEEVHVHLLKGEDDECTRIIFRGSNFRLELIANHNNRYLTPLHFYEER